jgi:hypothetical protein
MKLWCQSERSEESLVNLEYATGGNRAIREILRRLRDSGWQFRDYGTKS